MGPYSHIVIASRLEPYIQPEEPSEYYWGAVAPDARYTAKLKRRQTHINPQRIMGSMQKFPYLKSFLQGYLVHCISDELLLGWLLFPYFPFSLLRFFVPNPLIVVLLELYNFDHEPIKVEISLAHNDFFSALGLSEEDTAKYAQFISQYTVNIPVEARLTELARFFGLAKNRNIDEYLRTVRRFQENRLLRRTFFFGIRKARLNDRIAAKVLNWMPKGSLDQ